MSGRRAILVATALAGWAAPAAAGDVEPPARLVFARDTSLWVTDARGKGRAVELAQLPGPASQVRVIRSDPRGTTLLVDLGGRWYWTKVPAAGATAALTELPCAAGPARLAASGDCVLCTSAAGKAMLVKLGGRAVERSTDGATATLTERAGKRGLVWIEGGEVVAAPLDNGKARTTVAPTAPLRGFLASPDGTRAVGVYRATPPAPRGAADRDELFGFALDGVAARRRLIRNGVALDWSWDSRWLLIQDGGKACIARAVGGQFKCWKGYTAVSLSPDGAWALVLGQRNGAAPAPAAQPPSEEPGPDSEDGDGDDGDVAIPLPSGPLSLYRAKLAGAYTERPILIETVVDGAAAWLPTP